MDAEALRKQYPRLGMIGGVDKLEIAKGKASIDAEVEKAARVYATGGYIPCFDHAVPSTVSYDDYTYYLDKLRGALARV
jgi:uroporphyrinogen decarboxylase